MAVSLNRLSVPGLKITCLMGSRLRCSEVTWRLRLRCRASVVCGVLVTPYKGCVFWDYGKVKGFVLDGTWVFGHKM